MTPEALRGQIEQIRREALCAWAAFRDAPTRGNRLDRETRRAAHPRVTTRWDNALRHIDHHEALRLEMVRIEVDEIQFGQPRHARRVRALLDQVQRDREEVDRD
jgi:hypothetical protein